MNAGVITNSNLCEETININIHFSGLNNITSKLVFKGVHLFTSTYGLPLDVIVGRLNDSNMIVDWLDFYDDSLKSGEKPKSVKLKIENAIVDVFGPKYRDEVMNRLNEFRG